MYNVPLARWADGHRITRLCRVDDIRSALRHVGAKSSDWDSEAEVVLSYEIPDNDEYYPAAVAFIRAPCVERPDEHWPSNPMTATEREMPFWCVFRVERNRQAASPDVKYRLLWFILEAGFGAWDELFEPKPSGPSTLGVPLFGSTALRALGMNTSNPYTAEGRPPWPPTVDEPEWEYDLGDEMLMMMGQVPPWLWAWGPFSEQVEATEEASFVESQQPTPGDPHA